MRKTARVLAIALSVLMMLSSFSISGFAVATELEAGNSKQTATLIPEYGVEYVSSLDTAGEKDWFKFTTLPDGAYYTVTLKNYNMPYYDYGEIGNSSLAPNIYIYDTYLQQIVCAYNNSTRNFKLEPNTVYYIKIENGDRESTGNYSVKVDFRYDITPNDKDEASSMPLNTTCVNSFDGWGDVDWFKFTTTVAGDYTVRLKNNDLNGHSDNFPYGATDLSPNIFICDEDDATLHTSNNNVTFTVTLEANTTYYVKMVMGSRYTKQEGTYEITITAPNYVEKSLTEISVESMPDKTEYEIGEGFDADGLVIKASYSDGTSASITDYSLNGFDSSSAGEKTVTVTYTESGITKTTAFNVVIQEIIDDGENSFSFFRIFEMIIDLFMGMIDVIMSLITAM